VRIKKTILLWLQLNLIATLLILFFHVVSEDILMYKSDLLSIVAFISGILFLTLPITLILTVIVVLLNKIIPAPDPFLKLGRTILSFVSRAVAQSPDDLKRSLKQVSILIFIIVIFLFPLTKLLIYFEREGLYRRNIIDSSNGKKGAVLIVCDLLGAQYLPMFNPEAQVNTPHLRSFSEESILFPHCHTNSTNTYWAFRNIYAGVYATEKIDPKRNLISLLQNEGVNVRIISSHSNSMPDVTGQSYKGIRSLLLTENYVFLPRLLGIDYHIYRCPSHRVYKRKLFGSLNSFFPPKDPLETLTEEIEYAMVDGRKFFIVCHFFLTDYATDSSDIPLWQDNIKKDKDDIRSKIDKEMINNSYRYSEEQKWWVEEKRAKYISSIEQLDKRFGSFLKIFMERGWHRDVDIIFTADHGCSYEDGKIWYGYHVNEAVTWIPLVLYYSGLHKVDNRLCETTDIPPTVLDILNVKEKLSSQGFSLLKEGVKKEFTMTFGRDDTKHPSRPTFLVIYYKNKKYVFAMDYRTKKITYYSSYILKKNGRIERNPTLDYDIIEKLDGKTLTVHWYWPKW